MQKVPFVSKSTIEKIAETFPTPFHLYNEEGIRHTAHAVNQAFAWNPGFQEFYAVKACPNPAILKILQEYGCGCDCSSLSELLLAEACGFKGNQIMFSSNDTPSEEYALTYRLGATINLDDITHIDQLSQVTNGHFPKRISCRFNPGGVFQLSNGIMDNPGEAKYGMTEEQIFDAFARLQKAGVEEFGLHAFLASNTISDDYYAENARILFELAVQLHQKLHCRISFINLSGGVGIPYHPDQEPNDIYTIASKVQSAYERILTANGLGHVAIYTEMGRFMTGPHGCLVTQAIHRKNTHKQYIGVDACAADLMRPAMYGAYHHITVLGKENAPTTEIYDITGSLCENNDKFAIDRPLPHIDYGDYLVIHDTGAHGRAMGYNYNGKLRCGEVLLHPDDTFSIIRQKETIHDLFATLASCCPEAHYLLSEKWQHDHPELKQFMS